jgi:hypothetical protein
MDMSRLIKRWLTDERLRTEHCGRYVGVIDNVTMEMINNRFKGAKVQEPVIRFADGLLLVPNQGMRKALIALFGEETDGWRGQRVRIRRQVVTFTDRKTGEMKVRYEKVAEDPDVVPFSADPFTRTGEFTDLATEKIS